MVKSLRWAEAIELDAAEKDLAAQEARLERVIKQRGRASTTARKLKGAISEAYTTAVLLGSDLPAPDPKTLETLREAEAVLEASTSAEPEIRAAVTDAKARVAHLRGLLTGRKLHWASEVQESAAAALLDYLAGAAPHIARLMATSKVREVFAREPYKASADLPPAWSGFLAGHKLVASIPKRLRPEKLSDEDILKATAEQFLILRNQMEAYLNE